MARSEKKRVETQLKDMQTKLRAERVNQHNAIKALAYVYLRENEPEHNKLETIPKTVLAAMVRELWSWKLDNDE